MSSRFSAALFHRGKHLAENRLYDAQASCPVCLSNRQRTYVLQLQMNPEVVLLECSNCGGRSSSKMPTDDALDEYYRSYYREGEEKLTFHGVSRLATHIFKRIGPGLLLIPGTIRILDFGGGDGSLAWGIAELIVNIDPERSVEISLVDFNSGYSHREGRISLTARKSIQDMEGSFHIILASAIWEHIPKLNPVILDITSRLLTGGYFYARTPYVVPFKRIIKSLDFTFPGHVHDFGPAFWNRFRDTFTLGWSPLFSRASIVETQFGDAFIRTLLAFILKFPSRLEERLSGRAIFTPRWNYVGGWEVLFVNKK